MPRKARIRAKSPPDAPPPLTWISGGVGNPDRDALRAYARRLEQRLGRTPDDWRTRRERGLVAAELGDVPAAIDWLGTAAAAAREPREALRSLAQLQMKAARWADAEATFARVVALDPADAYHGRRLERWRLEAWGTRVTGVGALEHHFHQHGWVSGVYYPKVPPAIGAEGAGMAGFLEFCRFPQYGRVERESEFMAVAPYEGLMVIFPSYAYHRIVPFAGDAHRISIAFNALPVR